MRIQHNITAMNSYRNFSANNSRLSKNLEKLASGYKINRAGDDAAGLAISEKMRAQITGLEGATKNAKDGISLIQTAEGALTEVHDMLNRMVTLTEQSANGTYDDSLDRPQLQKEIDALKSEINRIADSVNYNGIKLLDGSLSGAGNMAGSVSVSSVEARQAAVQSVAFGNSTSGNVFAGGTTANTLAKNDKLVYTVSWKNADGTEESASVEFTVGRSNAETGTAVTSDATALIASDGTKYAVTEGGKLNGEELKNAVIAELNKNAAISAKFLASAGTAGDMRTTGATMETVDSFDNTNHGAASYTIQLDTKIKGKAGAEITGLEMTWHDLQDDGTYNVKKVTAGSGVLARQNSVNEMQELNLDNIRVLITSDVEATDGRIEANIFEIGGKKFALMDGSDAQAKDIDKLKAAVGSDVTLIQLKSSTGGTNKGTGPDGSSTAGNTESKTGQNYVANDVDAKIIAGELSRVTGMTFTQGIGNKNLDAAKGAGTSNKSLDTKSAVLLDMANGDKLQPKGEGKALMLQVGDTSDDFNRVGVSIGDMHVKALGLDKVDISTQDGAAAAVSIIKDAVNQVSDTRGGLGALQNRLDHTINNLGVMRENIQSAEGLIRDTDMAEEMMTYTKNNILNQSAQAMLAQANQLPQGVLQLLQ